MHSDKKRIRMVVTDLDGTYLRGDKTISDYTKKITERLRSAGVLFAVATARPVRAVRNFLPFVRYDIGIFHNGAVIHGMEGERMGFPVQRPYQIVRRMLQAQPELHIAAEFEDSICANFDAATIWRGIEYTHTEDFAMLQGKTADKLLVEARSLEAAQALEQYLDSGLYVRLSENVVAMIMDEQATKLRALELLSERYGIAMDEIAAFGDDRNDVDMLTGCGIGIAVANALDEVKSIADEVCLSNEEDGPARWLAAHFSL